MSLEFSTDRERLDVAMIHAFLADSYWVPGISRAAVEKSIRHSLCFGVYDSGRQIAFARVVTDYVRYAYLMDVFVLPQYRGRGISKLLMENILSHPELQTISRYALHTRDAHDLYGQYGFAAPANPERLMELLRRPRPAPEPDSSSR